MRTNLAFPALLVYGFLVSSPAHATYRVSRELALDACQAAVFSGWSLTEQDSKDLEARLRGKPSDAEARTVLIGYYAHNVKNTAKGSMNQDLVRHLTWIIRNQPWAAVAGSDSVHVSRYQGPGDWDRLKGLWLEAAQAHRDDPRVLGNAAHFIFQVEPARSASLLEEAIALDPDDPYWHKRVAASYRQLARNASGSEQKRLRGKAVAELEKALTLQRGHKRTMALDSLAEAALEAGDIAKAQDRANEILAAETGKGSAYNRSQAEMILARAALASGDTAAMRRFMQSACEDAGKPVFYEPFPNMDLIEELLAHNDKEDALAYLKLCEKAWPEHAAKLKEWSELVGRGQTPSFSDWFSEELKPAAASATNAQ
jgi:tetratricopeptide (TPR) repeat protein